LKKILYHIPYPSSTGAERWIYEGWRDAFEDMGHQCHPLTAFDSLENKVEIVRPDIFMTAVNIIDFSKQAKTLKRLREQGIKIFMWVHWPLVPSCRLAEPFLLSENLVDIYFGEREPEGMADFEEKIGKKYHVIPNAANKKLHYQVKAAEKYDYDLVYLGAKLPMKQWFFENILIPLSKKYRVGIFGPYWTVKDNVYRGIVKSFQYIRFEKGISYVNKLRIQVPPEEENLLYSSAKIALNFHERDEDCMQSHKIVNQRTFKIPACGGFQLCDDATGIRRYFNEDELVTVKPIKSEWLDTIEYYLNRPEEREKIRLQGNRRARNEHTYHNRVEQLLTLYQSVKEGI